MTTIFDLSSSQLKRAADLKDQIDALNAELAALLGSPSVTVAPAPAPAPAAPAAAPAKRGPKKGGMSAEGRARIAEAQRARWAKINSQKKPAAAPVVAKPAKKRKMSAAGRAAIIAAQKARWAKVKASKKA